VAKRFLNEPAARFVGDLRNYMLHKGLPPSEMFLHANNEVYGIDESVFAEVSDPIERVMEVPWAAGALSRQFVEGQIVRWLQASFRQASPDHLSQVIAIESKKSVRPVTLWAPIARLEVQSEFALGPVHIKPMSKEMMDELRVNLLRTAGPRTEDVKKLHDDLRENMQGLAAVVVEMDAEPDLVREQGEMLARSAVGLLRFLSPTASLDFPPSAVALLGSELEPSSSFLTLGNDTFSYQKRMLSPPIGEWRISDAVLSRFLQSDLNRIGPLIHPEGLSPFALAVRTSMLLYSAGSTLHDPVDRLLYILSALESLLVRHQGEAREFNVEERMSLVLSRTGPPREEVRRRVRMAYRLRLRRENSSLTPEEKSSFGVFVNLLHLLLRIALQNVHSFPTIGAFIDALEGFDGRPNGGSEEASK